MKMTMTQFREWVAATEFTAEQGAELGGEAHKSVGYTDDGDDLADSDQAAEIDGALESKGFLAFDFDALLPPVTTTDINEESDMETITLENDNAPEVRFTGELIATAKSSSNNASVHYSGATGRWTELRLYRTAGGRYVAQSVGHTQWAGEHTRYNTVVCETAADVIAFFGHGWLAKELYGEAGIEDVQHVE